MITATMHEAKSKLSELVKQAQAGEEVWITSGKDKKPVAQIVATTAAEKPPITPESIRKKRLGLLADPKYIIPDSFWDPLPEAELALWEGEDEK